MRGALIFVVALGCRSEELPANRVAACSKVVAAKTGEATHYKADGSGNCSFEASRDRMVAAINGTDYTRAAWCGACLEVLGPAGAIIVRVVDKCPGCKPGDLDLSEEAFALLAPLDKGRIPIAWRPIACHVTGALAYRFKDGSNPFWTAIQIRNHRHPVSGLDVRDPKGQWQPLARAEYNYFVSSRPLGEGPYALRVTDVFDHVVVDEAIALGDAVTRDGTAQLPACLEPWL